MDSEIVLNYSEQIEKKSICFELFKNLRANWKKYSSFWIILKKTAIYSGNSEQIANIF